MWMKESEDPAYVYNYSATDDDMSSSYEYSSNWSQSASNYSANTATTQSSLTSKESEQVDQFLSSLYGSDYENIISDDSSWNSRQTSDQFKNVANMSLAELNDALNIMLPYESPNKTTSSENSSGKISSSHSPTLKPSTRKTSNNSIFHALYENSNDCFSGAKSCIDLSSTSGSNKENTYATSPLSSNRSSLCLSPCSTSSSLTKVREFNLQTEKRSRIINNDIVKKEEKECTFRPKINSTSSSIVQCDKFHDRLVKWQEKKRKETERKREELLQEENTQCTFKPKVFSVSSNTESDACIKLFNSATKLVEKKKHNIKKLEQEEMKECSFKPSISGDPSVQSRYLDQSKKSTSTVEDEECTFQPNIRKSIGGQNSSYLKSNPFERLSKVNRSRMEFDEKDSLLDELTDLESVDSSNQSSWQSSRPSSAPSSRGGRAYQASVEETSRKTFKDFIDRQQNTMKRKEQKINFIKSNMEHSHKPSINKTSIDLAKNRSKTPFEERVKNEINRKKLNERQQSALAEKNCTFQPQINKTSKQLPSRGVEELSKGDLNLKQKKIEQTKKVLERSEFKDVTFKPKTNNGTKAKSILKLSTEPETYIERITQYKERNEYKKKMMLLSKEQKELEECTFKPQIHDAPVYVKEIAKSMAFARQLENQEIQIKWR
ncbi:predicted protein [Naegleria gruberi]|uniref:Predicted protein n=1 Tax=Naegleria gruberi TaxID=5762 RepID=D2V2K0_NAEGR|nr:uncharacterized protein NAEGRDRAFT_46181 [Naegleria gruberi]EFC48910.1 predicted protein [Naegleria gruberi]|eukprot:XP_002681654.1 predicted protein [Naegleria gruberi strain NEG-M]